MQARWLIVPALLLAAIAALLVLRGCGTPAQAPTPPDAAQSAGGTRATSTSDGADAARIARDRRRDESIRDAVSTVHRYLAALTAPDRGTADAFWVDAHPAASGESDLRDWSGVVAMRTSNGDPVPLDSEDPPRALQIPVDVRIDGGGGRHARYLGWYRVRRGIDGVHWRITSASLDRQAR